MLALLAAAGCGDALAVDNMGSPDVARVLSSAASVEAAVGGFGSQLYNPLRGTESVNTQSKLLSDESYASVANFGMAARFSDRAQISNDLGNTNAASNINVYQTQQRVARLVANTITAYNRLRTEGKPLLTPTNENRMRAFAYLILGQALGNVALAYDSGAVVGEGVSTTDIPGLSSAAVLGAAAIAALDSAVIIANRGMTATPATWISAVSLDQANFIRLARSYRARIRAAIARTPAERAAVDWAAVIADATNGISADFVLTVNGQTGWSAAFDAGQIYVTGGWHAFPMRYAGMADSSGAYQAWIATPSSGRRAFLVQTLDGRWPTGTTRPLQQATTPNNIILPRYVRNRPSGDDVLSPGDGESYYDHRRYGLTQSNTGVSGPYTEMSKTEMDMLAAEGYIRTNQHALAEPLINISRLRNGLPSVVGVGAAGVVPGGAACVPKLPNGSCGSLLEAMKYEKRMETAFTGYMPWYTDARGWGDLVAGTVVEWPVPYQEMQYRGQPYYNGLRVSVGPSTYGF